MFDAVENHTPMDFVTHFTRAMCFVCITLMSPLGGRATTMRRNVSAWLAAERKADGGNRGIERMRVTRNSVAECSLMFHTQAVLVLRIRVDAAQIQPLDDSWSTGCESARLRENSVLIYAAKDHSQSLRHQ